MSESAIRNMNSMCAQQSPHICRPDLGPIRSTFGREISRKLTDDLGHRSLGIVSCICKLSFCHDRKCFSETIRVRPLANQLSTGSPLCPALIGAVRAIAIRQVKRLEPRQTLNQFCISTVNLHGNRRFIESHSAQGCSALCCRSISARRLCDAGFEPFPRRCGESGSRPGGSAINPWPINLSVSGMLRLLVHEPSQPEEMLPIATVRVAAVSIGEIPLHELSISDIEAHGKRK